MLNPEERSQNCSFNDFLGQDQVKLVHCTNEENILFQSQRSSIIKQAPKAGGCASWTNSDFADRADQA